MRPGHDRPSVARTGSSGIMAGSLQRSYPFTSDIETYGRVHLITCDLWEAVTGEKLNPSNLSSVLDVYFPAQDNNGIANPQISQQQQYVQMSKDPVKSRNLQKRIQDCPPSELAIIFKSLAPCLNELVYDQSANFVIQKICEFATKEQNQILLQFFLSDIHKIVEHQIACRVLQRFIECTDRENVDALFTALSDNLMNLCLSQNGNHIIQRFVVALPDKLNIIINCILPNVIPLAVDNCGCRIVQRLFEAYDISQLSPIVTEVMKNAVELATNQYGNYVVQYILASEKREYVSQLLHAFKGRFYTFSIHKFASNVIEKCIRGATPEEREEVFAEIIGTEGNFKDDRILSMVEDQFGNYVIQRIIEFGTQAQQNAVYNIVYDNYEILHQRQYARHVFTRLINLGYEF